MRAHTNTHGTNTRARTRTRTHARQTKNVSGRLLVGLRWWNEVTDTGSNWRFESLEEGQRAINGKDSAVFWWLLYVMARWCFLCID